ncbi:hypothetical protein ES705_26356 [subsurface metagenome]
MFNFLCPPKAKIIDILLFGILLFPKNSNMGPTIFLVGVGLVLSSTINIIFDFELTILERGSHPYGFFNDSLIAISRSFIGVTTSGIIISTGLFFGNLNFNVSFPYAISHFDISLLSPSIKN